MGFMPDCQGYLAVNIQIDNAKAVDPADPAFLTKPLKYERDTRLNAIGPWEEKHRPSTAGSTTIGLNPRTSRFVLLKAPPIYTFKEDTMSYHTLLLETNQHIGTITLNRPNQLNTFSSELAIELNQALLDLDENPDVYVIVIKGAGKAFCAGIDISEFAGKNLEEYHRWVGLMERMALRVTEMKKPVIASAKGLAVANGAGIIAAADLAIIAEGTRIGTTAINVGLFCMGPAIALSRSLGRKRSLEMLLTGDMIHADQALAWGLVNQVVPKDKLDEATDALAKKLAEKSPIALQMGKQAFYKTADMEFGKALEYSNHLFAALCTTEDAKEGVSAFLEKRKPTYKGR
jgi:enoyl-CoA hydratase/carnithine racemase